MNPLELRGAEFLVFYVALATVILGALLLLRWWRESTLAGHVRLSDPFLIAYLRGGEDEALRVAAVSLLDRDLVKSDGRSLETQGGADAVQRVEHPLQKAILECFAEEADMQELLKHPGPRAATRPLRQALEQQGLVAGDEVRRSRLLWTMMAVAFLWAVALAKLFYALTRGHTNVWFLVVTAVAVAAAVLYSPLRTHAGDRVVADLQTLFEGLHRRRDSLRTGQGEEIALLAAVYGLNALPDGGPWWPIQGVTPRKEESSDGWGSGSSGSSCSSGGSGSSCSSGGSSCGGGGGCGGGCGGCGG